MTILKELNKTKKVRAEPGIDPGASRILSKNHIPLVYSANEHLSQSNRMGQKHGQFGRDQKHVCIRIFKKWSVNFLTLPKTRRFIRVDLSPTPTENQLQQNTRPAGR